MLSKENSVDEAERALHQVSRTWSPYASLPVPARGILKRAWDKIGFSGDFGSLARYELDMLLLRIGCALNPAYHRQVANLRSRRHLQIHLGCGNTLKPGWVNVDCYPPKRVENIEVLVTEMSRTLPFADQSASSVYSEHFLEHVPFELVRKSLVPECFRILEPGGTIRMGVPDGELWIREYQPMGANGGQPAVFEGEPAMMSLNKVARSSLHRYLYDYETLEIIFREAGFTGLRKSKANDSRLPPFESIDQTDPWRVAFTVYIEGKRPFK